MSVWVIVPVKPLKRAKSRLSSVLSAEQRFEFAEAMYRQVLSVVLQAQSVAGVLVISRDTKALSIARDMGVKTIQESSPSDLNPALHRATQMAKLWRADATLILPVDLPFLTVNDVDQMVGMGRGEDPCIVIATDREKDGTNAMLIRPPDLIGFQYGDGSFIRHVSAAREQKAKVYIYASDTISLDIDVVADLNTYNEIVLSGQYGQSLAPFLPKLSAN